ncbi:MAG: glycosyltransferase [Armatimonadetes bacterium]|nr:glycosyltransferase [Armatimonadota bacterium]
MVNVQSPLVVLHSVGSWLPQTQTWLHNQVCYLPAEITSHIVCDRTENLDQFGVPNIHCTSKLGLRRVVNGVLRRLGLSEGSHRLVAARRCGAGVLHSHFGDQAWYDIPAARSAGIKHVATFYGFDINYLPRTDPSWSARYLELFDSVDRILCEGPHMADCIVRIGCPEEKVRVHHLGVRTDEIAFRPRQWNGTEPLRVLIAASFREKKGIPYALDALGRIAGEVALEVTVIGDALNDERSQMEKAKIEAMIDKHRMGGILRMLGFQPADVVFREAYNHHVYLSPSITAQDGDTEGGAPVAIIDMLATGMPVVSTRHCDIPEVVQDGVSGLLADERDVDGLADRLMWLVHHAQEWSNLAEAGRQQVELHFNARVQGLRLAEIYEELRLCQVGTSACFRHNDIFL